MNCCNLPSDGLYDYIEWLNLCAEYQRAWVELYVNLYQFYLPKQ
jgi:hypothetical protein